jgi:hypothetical protein
MLVVELESSIQLPRVHQVEFGSIVSRVSCKTIR